MTDKPRVPLIVISGLATEFALRTADVLHRSEPSTAVVHYDLRQVERGILRRRLRLGPRDQLTVLELAHDCVSCTLREDLLPLLRKLTELPSVQCIAIHLDEAMEPEPVCWALDNVTVGDRPISEDVEIEAVVTVIDVASWLTDATTDVTLDERGIRTSPNDERTVAHVALSQVEFADVIVFAGVAPDAWDAARMGAVLDRLAPRAGRVELSTVDSLSLRSAVPLHARRGEVTDAHDPLLAGQPPLHADCGVALLTFSAQRPFHPGRLHDCLGVLFDGVVRAKGRAWLATQPDVALWLESAGGGMMIGHAGPWLDSPDGPAWEDVSAERSTLAALRWHPVFGDRAQELLVLTHEAAPESIESALRGALLTDSEIADGPDVWRTYEDPFDSWHTEPCDDTRDLVERDDANVNPGREYP